MNRIIITLWCLISSTNVAKTQDQGYQDKFPYFIMAYVDHELRDPFDQTSNQATQFYKILYRLERGSLFEVDTLNATEGLRMDIMLNYPEEGLMYFEESGIATYHDFTLNSPDKYVSVLDYKNGLKLRRYRRSWDVQFNSPGSVELLKVNDSLFFYNEFKYNKRRDIQTYYGFDKNLIKREIKPADFQNPVVPSYPTFQRAFPFGHTLTYYDEGFSDLKLSRYSRRKKIFENKNYDQLLSADIQLPDSLKNVSNFVFSINNDRYCIGAGIPLVKQAVNDSTWAVKILNKATNIWQEIEFKYTGRAIMNWEDWLYGSIYKKGSPEEKVRLSLNEKYRDRYDSTFGKYPVQRLKNRMGLLFLYHIPSQQYLEWQTGDYDSEIILITDEIIFYRVFDEIRSVSLNVVSNEINWETDELVIKDTKRVPNIHWMFLGDKMKVQETWVNTPIHIDSMKKELGTLFDEKNANIVWMKYMANPDLRKDRNFIATYLEFYKDYLKSKDPFIGKAGYWLNSTKDNKVDEVMGISSFQSLEKGEIRILKNTKLQKLKNNFFVGEVEKLTSIKGERKQWKYKGKTVFFPKKWNEEKIREELILAINNSNKIRGNNQIFRSKFSDGTALTIHMFSKSNICFLPIAN